MSSNKLHGTRSAKKNAGAVDPIGDKPKGKSGRKSAKADQAVDSGSQKRKSISSSKVANKLLITAASSSDSDSDASSASASHAAKRLAKAGAAAEAVEIKRRQDEEVIRKDKMVAAMTAKLADPTDDGLMSVNELNAMSRPSSIRPLFPKVANHCNTDMGPLVEDSLRIIAARPNAAIFHGAISGVVKELGEGVLIFLAKSVKMELPKELPKELPAIEIASSSSSAILPPVMKDVIVVEIYQFYTPP